MLKLSKEQAFLFKNCADQCNGLIAACTELANDCASHESMHCVQLYGLVDQKSTAAIKACVDIIALSNKFLEQNVAEHAALFNEVIHAATECSKGADDLRKIILAGSKDYREQCNEVIEKADRCFEVCTRLGRQLYGEK